MLYYSTNKKAPLATLEKAVVKGLAEDRGLYMPEQIKQLPQEFFDNIDKMSFQEIACTVADAFFGEDIPQEDLHKIVCNTLAFDVPAVKVTDSIYSLELFHGPTLAFKDVGARFMARLLGYFTTKEKTLSPALPHDGEGASQNAECQSSGNQSLPIMGEMSEGQRGSLINVLVATSGDTGSAVANGFLGVPGVHVYVLYPKGKVSPIQECQFTTLGQNITALEVDGVFDDCQALVKSAFMDADLNAHMKLTSANSINVARFLPQSFYYFYAYAQMKRTLSPALPHNGEGASLNGDGQSNANQNLPITGEMSEGQRGSLVVCVPSGNFGNICSALFGTKMGLPIKRFIAANNANDIFYNYLQTGKYEPKASVQTIANAMDVGDPSNFARIYELYKQDHAAICKEISGCTYKDEQIAETMRECLKETGYQLDPHGACGYRALKEQLQPGETGIFLETAHPAKFKGVVDEICGGDVAIPEKLAAFMKGEKKSIEIGKDFEGFKQFLMKQ